MRPAALFALAAAAALLLAPFAGGTLALAVATQIAVAAVFATSYNTLLAGCGLLSFGHAAYYGVGAFATAHLLRWVEASGAAFPVVLAPLAGAAAGAAAALLLGWFTTHRGSIAFAMLSLAVGQLLLAAGAVFAGLTGGEGGLRLDRTAGLALPGGGLASQGAMYACALFWALPSIALMALFRRTPLGRLAAAVRENEDRVAFIGVRPRAVRFRVLVVSAAFAGLAGGLYALNFEVVTLEALGIAASGAVLFQTILGGHRHLLGPVVGAATVTLLGTAMSAHTELSGLYLGLLFVAAVLFLPDGVLGFLLEEARRLAAGGPAAGLARFLGRYVPAAAALALLVVGLETVAAWREGSPGLPLAGFRLDPGAAATWLGLGAAAAVVGAWLRRGVKAATLPRRAAGAGRRLEAVAEHGAPGRRG